MQQDALHSRCKDTLKTQTPTNPSKPLSVATKARKVDTDHILRCRHLRRRSHLHGSLKRTQGLNFPKLPGTPPRPFEKSPFLAGSCRPCTWSSSLRQGREGLRRFLCFFLGGGLGALFFFWGCLRCEGTHCTHIPVVGLQRGACRSDVVFGSAAIQRPQEINTVP